MSARDIAAATAMVGCGLAAAAIGAIRTAERRIEAAAGPIDERDDCPSRECRQPDMCSADYCWTTHSRAGRTNVGTRNAVVGTDRALGGTNG